MSSYLSFYLKLKEENTKPVFLTCYHRNDPVYQSFYENISIAYAGNEETYTHLTINDVNRIIADLKGDISNVKKRITTYKEHANGSLEIINEIISSEEYLEELISTLHSVYFIQDLVNNTENSIGDYSEVLCNID
jgi:hypothetical protein